MRKLFIYLAVTASVLLSAESVFGQKTGLKFSFGAASYRMDDMKELQKYILSTYPVEGKITSSFPPFSTFSITFVRALYEQIRIGGGYGFSTTGGKSSYADYTGNIFTTMDATSHRFEGYISYVITGSDRLELLLCGRAGANLTYLTIESYYNVLYYSNGIFNRYRSLSPNGSVATELNVNFSGFSIGLEAGYQVDLTGNLKDADNGNALLDPYDREKTLTSDWTGWRVLLSVSIWLRH